jgi:hypothetical protein
MPPTTVDIYHTEQLIGNATLLANRMAPGWNNWTIAPLIAIAAGVEVYYYYYCCYCT